MRFSIYILASSALVLSACSSTQNTSRTSSTDDTYYSLADAQKTAEPVYHEEIKTEDVSPANSSDYTNDNSSEGKENFDYNQYKKDNGIDENSNSSNSNYSTPDYSEQYADDEGRTYITNNYYGDYYDDDDEYYYSRRLSRFHSPYVGFGYYSPAYCGFYYDPFYYSPGWSISIGYSWGWGGYSYGFCDPWYYPYYSWYSPWYYPSAYHHGYWNGYHDGYWNGVNDGGGYYQSSTVYGPRGGKRGGEVTERGRPLIGSGAVLASNETKTTTVPGRSRDNAPNQTASPSDVRSNTSTPRERGNVSTGDTKPNSTPSDISRERGNVPTGDDRTNSTSSGPRTRDEQPNSTSSGPRTRENQPTGNDNMNVKPNGYTPPSLPDNNNNSERGRSNSDVIKSNPNTNSDDGRVPSRNYSAPRERNNPPVNVETPKRNNNYSSPQPSQPRRDNTPRQQYSRPSQPSQPSYNAPSRSSGNSGGGNSGGGGSSTPRRPR